MKASGALAFRIENFWNPPSSLALAPRAAPGNLSRRDHSVALSRISIRGAGTAIQCPDEGKEATEEIRRTKRESVDDEATCISPLVIQRFFSFGRREKRAFSIRKKCVAQYNAAFASNRKISN